MFFMSLMTVTANPFETSWFAHIEMNPIKMIKRSRKAILKLDEIILLLMSDAGLATSLVGVAPLEATGKVAAVVEVAAGMAEGRRGWWRCISSKKLMQCS